ncbi:MtrAB system histidine kinase MtrB [Corynebacterium pseudodiphtheriticum]|uniref:MtrAB system histidine kinase MtrB n=1 Tax=Corynebacterium pseudodiphtheriticum TaxID=37637 RepID=UPI002543A573|nr:MtrAB system histidine kinase MtrB [Corynebacterium pseudodiphtheriticum]MDK4284498.1 MtrAB system histidine kinase MtrB [Corynebacterium pseudodiphtheriticum]
MRIRLVEFWRTSLQVRLIVSIFVSSLVVMLVLAFALISVITQRLVDQKLDVASQEIDRARFAVEQQINATGSANSVQVRITSARASISHSSSESTDLATIYDTIIVVDNGDGSLTTAPEGFRVPAELRRYVSEGQVSYQFTPVERADGTVYDALLIGSPTESDIPGAQVYLALSMESEASTMALLRGLLSTAGVVVLVLLVGIAWLATQQVILPIRSASRTAQRLAGGHLRERMVVEGEDEMARLAMSFNDMADKLVRQINQLEEYGNLQRQFTSDVSHELRTPLTTVRMAADMIASDSESLGPHTRRASELMTRELDKFEDLLGDLLEISRHDAGVADLSETQIDVRSSLESAWNQVEHLADKLNVRVRFTGLDEPLTIAGDSRRIERILRNLLANAIDHSEGNPVLVNAAANDHAIAITIADRGVGLKEGQEELVFHRFWRADVSRKRHSGGTGLGLAIAREDAQLHGGILDAIGELGVGSTFRLVLPRTPRGPVDPAPLELAVTLGADEPELTDDVDDAGAEADSGAGTGGDGNAE